MSPADMANPKLQGSTQKNSGRPINIFSTLMAYSLCLVNSRFSIVKTLTAFVVLKIKQVTCLMVWLVCVDDRCSGIIPYCDSMAG